MTVVLKLGGSVITDKDTPETVDWSVLDAVCSTIAAYDTDIVIVHGGGSFGHHHAAAHGVSQTTGTRDDTAVRDVHRAMKRLNTAVVDALSAAGVPAIPVHPLSIAHRSAEGELRLPTEQVRTLLADGFVPVLHGDVIAHEETGATVLSGDELVCALAEALSADRVGLCSAVPGVLDGEHVIPEIDDFEDVAHALGGSDATDVTGGMAGKVRALLALETSAFVFDQNGLEPFLGGGQPGTRIG
ncbi:isopentenyl phosphate kinase [Halocatena pleomorpha]|uniref:Isopentenyl phosphate kinase n=1 Tax=Halocatena pleomorpha TaxID=1785090 RepID=A0A3P3R3X5_9EURY|nr:isopentenyl phosphate kinase [Halocatena pleomorpha]RRJ28177.1 isopentenyl phosphate kinase family protein [Halocatena pleomorpha]